MWPLTKPVEYDYYTYGQDEPVHVTDHTQSELSDFGIFVVTISVIVIMIVVSSLIWCRLFSRR